MAEDELKDRVKSLLNSHIGDMLWTNTYVPEDNRLGQGIRVIAFTSDVSATVDGTEIPAGNLAMWYLEDMESDVIEIANYQMCYMESTKDNGASLTGIVGSTVYEDRPPMPIVFSEYAFAILRTEIDAPDDALMEAIKGIKFRVPEPEEYEPIPALDKIAVTTRVVPNSKPTQVLRRGQASLLFTDGGMPLSVSKRRGQTQIRFELQNEDTSIQTSSEIDAEDVAVIEAVTTLRHAGNNVISPYQIADTMGYEPTPELQEEIHGRVIRLMGIVGRIDWTAQAKKWHITNPETGEPYEHAEIIGNLLSMTVFNGTDVKGNRYVRYKVASDPITYEHARLVGQVIEYPQELLDLAPIDEDGKEKKRVTREQHKLERAILWYIFSLKSPKNNMNELVSYEALFDYEGFAIGSTSARKRAIKFIHAYLRALQKAGVIYGFVPQVERGSRHLQTGVRIIVEKPSRGKR